MGLKEWIEDTLGWSKKANPVTTPPPPTPQLEKRDICPVCGYEIVWGHPMTPGYGVHGKCKPEALRIILLYNSLRPTITEEKK